MTSIRTHGASYIGSRSRVSCGSIEVKGGRHDARIALTMMPLRPLAPPPLAYAILHIWSIAADVNRISIPEYPNRAVYCDTRELLTSVRTRRRSDGVNGDKVVIEGILEMNSGMNLGRKMGAVRSQTLSRKLDGMRKGRCNAVGLPILDEIWECNRGRMS